jgi:hypothetical protein
MSGSLNLCDPASKSSHIETKELKHQAQLAIMKEGAL